LNALLSGTHLGSDVDSLRAAGLNVNTIDLGGAHQASLIITEDQAHQLVQDGLHFAANDYVTLQAGDIMAADGVHASGTHLHTALKDLQKLGVDATGHDTNNLGIDALGLTGVSHLQDLNSLTAILKDAGVDSLGLHSSEMVNAQGQETDLFKAFESLDWIQNGVDVTLEIDNKAPNAAATSGLSDNAALNHLVNHGIQFADGQSWGSLLETLHESGLGRVEVESNANLHIGDDLSAALYEAGMLHALPEANIEIDVAEQVKLLNTSLKAMSDLGVDKVHAFDKVYVKLGITESELAGMHDLFSAFGLDSNTAAPHNLFDNNGQGAGLVLDDTMAKAMGIGGDHVDEAKVADLVKQLSKLGITEVDVVSGTEAAHKVDVYHIDVVAQTPVLATPVELLGVNDDLSHVFDPDILHKTIKP
jgi:hypothetical protein